MGLGLGITLIVAGAILGFTDIVDNAANTDLDTVGWILLGAGVLSLAIGMMMNAQRGRSEHVSVVEHRETGVPATRRVVQEREVVEPDVRRADADPDLRRDPL